MIENCTQSQFVIQITCLDFLVEVPDNISSKHPPAHVEPEDMTG